MHTYFLDRNEVRAYLAEFAGRLRGIGSDMPRIWFPIGVSGEELLYEFDKSAPGLTDGYGITMVYTQYDKDTGRVQFDDEASISALDGNMLVLDSIVHSGRSLEAVTREAETKFHRQVSTYSLVVSRGSKFIPNIWGLMINDHDRACFLAKTIPNNRLSEGSPWIRIRRLSANDLGSLSALNQIETLRDETWKQLVHDNATSGPRMTFLVEDGSKTAGFAIIELRPTQSVKIKRLAVLAGTNNAVYAEALVRWSETLARQSDCERIQVYITPGELPKYEEWKFSCGSDSPKNAPYIIVSRPVTYHVNDTLGP